MPFLLLEHVKKMTLCYQDMWNGVAQYRLVQEIQEITYTFLVICMFYSTLHANLKKTWQENKISITQSAAKTCGMETRAGEMLNSWCSLLALKSLTQHTAALICVNRGTWRWGMASCRVFIAHDSATDRWLLAAGSHRLPDGEWEAAVQSDPS